MSELPPQGPQFADRDFFCPQHPDFMLGWDGLNLFCEGCILADHSTESEATES
jgi:hypothetical protein